MSGNLDLKTSKHVSACLWNKMTFESVLLYLFFLVVLYQASIPVLAAKQVLLCKYHLYYVKLSTVVLLLTWREAQNVSNKKTTMA